MSLNQLVLLRGLPSAFDSCAYSAIKCDHALMLTQHVPSEFAVTPSFTCVPYRFGLRVSSYGAFKYTRCPAHRGGQQLVLMQLFASDYLSAITRLCVDPERL